MLVQGFEPRSVCLQGSRSTIGARPAQNQPSVDSPHAPECAAKACLYPCFCHERSASARGNLGKEAQCFLLDGHHRSRLCGSPPEELARPSNHAHRRMRRRDHRVAQRRIASYKSRHKASPRPTRCDHSMRQHPRGDTCLSSIDQKFFYWSCLCRNNRSKKALLALPTASWISRSCRATIWLLSGSCPFVALWRAWTCQRTRASQAFLYPSQSYRSALLNGQTQAH